MKFPIAYHKRSEIEDNDLARYTRETDTQDVYIHKEANEAIDRFVWYLFDHPIKCLAIAIVVCLCLSGCFQALNALKPLLQANGVSYGWTVTGTFLTLVPAIIGMFTNKLKWLPNAITLLGTMILLGALIIQPSEQIMKDEQKVTDQRCTIVEGPGMLKGYEGKQVFDVHCEVSPITSLLGE